MANESAACTECGAALPAGARFCPQCGTRVASLAAAGERRPVAVLFADLAGFTRLTSESDPEAVRDLLGRFFAEIDGAVVRAGGTIDKHIGDATMAVFGAPIAHGNDIERAVRAACEIHDAMAGLAAEFGRPLAAHVAIASGEVVAAPVGSAARNDYTVTGDAVNLASRLEELSRPGETIVSDAVRRALGDRLDVASRGSVEVRGLAGAQPVWQVRSLREASAASGRLVGRAHERERFAALARTARTTGRGATLVLRADPGVGKSRLAEALQDDARRDGWACHAATVLDFGVGLGRDVVSLLARSLLALPTDASADACRVRLGAAVATGRVADDDEPFVADLLGLVQRGGTRFEAMDASVRALGRVQALRSLADAAAREGPIVVTVEDLQWADAPLLDALAALRECARERPLVLLLTTRHEGDPSRAWLPDGVEVLELQPLSQAESLELARSVLHAVPEFAQRCAERAQGNPLFLIQLLQAGGEDGAVPETIGNLVLARLDRLPADEKGALQAAAVAGQRFDAALVAHLVGRPATFAEARARGLVRDGGVPGELAFAHALIRDGVYASLLHSARRALHGRAAAWYQGRDAVLRAEHLERAEDARAAEAFLDAARAEAKALHTDVALRLAQRGASIARADAVAFALEILAGRLARDLGDAQASVAAFDRALARAGDDAHRCRALVGIAAGHRLTSAAEAGFAALDAAEPLAQRLHLTREQARIAYLRGALHFARGDLDACARQHERALALAKEAGDELLQAHALSGLADVLYASGRMASARRAFGACVDLCERHGDVHFSLPNRNMMGICEFYLGDLAGALAQSERVRDAARRIGHRVAEVMADEVAGFALVGAGHDAAAVEPIMRSLPLARAIGSRRFAAIDLVMLGHVARRAGDLDGARRHLDESAELLGPIGPKFAGAMLLSARARVAASRDECARLMAEGEALLADGALSHNHFWYRGDAIDVALEAGDAAAARRHADALERYASVEPTPWSDFTVARARALADAIDGRADVPALRALHVRASALDLRAALPALDAALAEKWGQTRLSEQDEE
jgi:class 3 adenylate cyclase/tetratricopeptide (TPR) repeat protein